MSESVNYTNAPITEALFDVRAVLPAGSDYKIFEKLQKMVGKDFPTKEISLMYKTSIKLDDKKDPVYGTEGGINGFIYKSVDGKKIIQFKH